MKDINATRQAIEARIADSLGRVTLLNGFRQDAETLRHHLKVINASKANYMMAYVESASELAEFAQKHSIPVRPLRAIMSCAGTLTTDARATLRRVFGADVRNKYGSRECAEIGCECEHGSMHVYSHNLIVEIVDDVGRPVAPGHPGRVLVTLLSNPEFPLIRYEIGDIAIQSDRECPCGRVFDVIDGVEGRTIEQLTDVRGNRVSPVFLRHLIGVVHRRDWITRFCLKQNGRHYTLELVAEQPSPGDLQEFSEAVVKDLRAVLGDEAGVAVKLGSRDQLSEKWLWFRNQSNEIPS